MRVGPIFRNQTPCVQGFSDQQHSIGKNFQEVAGKEIGKLGQNVLSEIESRMLLSEQGMLRNSQRLLQEYKQEAMEEDGMNELEAEVAAKERLPKEINKRKNCIQERAVKLFQANQEIAIKISRKSSVKVRFSPKYVIQRFNPKKAGYVGILEEKSIDNVKTREDYLRNYSEDYSAEKSRQFWEKRRSLVDGCWQRCWRHLSGCVSHFLRWLTSLIAGASHSKD